MSTEHVSLDLPAIRGQVFGSRGRDPEISRITGKQLRRVEYVLAVQGDDGQEQLEAVIAAATSGETPIPDADGGEWVVSDYKFSFSATQSEPVYTYEIELTEVEVLSLNRVEFEGLTLTPAPDQWKLDSDDEHFWIWFLADLGPDEHQRFESALEQHAGTYFPVRLAGMTDDPIQMRFGRCLWKRIDDSTVRHRIALVAEGGDDEAEGLLAGLNQPELARTIEQAVIIRTQMAALLEELQLVGTLDAEAVERVRSLGSIENVPFADQREKDRAVNIEAFLD